MYKCYKSWGMIILCQTSLARNEDYGMRQSKVTRHFDEIIFNSYVSKLLLTQLVQRYSLSKLRLASSDYESV